MALGFILCCIVRISFIYMILSHILKLVGSLTSSYTLHWVLYLGLSVFWVSYVRPLSFPLLSKIPSFLVCIVRVALVFFAFYFVKDVTLFVIR